MFEIKATQTTCARVGKSFAKRANTAVTVEIKEKTDIQRKASSYRALDRRRRCTPTRVGFPFFVTPKRTKRRIGFMRRSGNRIGQGIVLLPGTELKRNHARNAPRQKNKRKFIRAKVRKQTSLPQVNRKPPPSYHISYNQALDFYKRIRKGKKFHASRKVIWRNRHRLFVTATIKKNNRYYEGDLYPLKE